MAAKGKNKLKRKRGKKFRFFEGTAGDGKKEDQLNPFEEHSSSKKAVRDKLKVLTLLICIIIDLQRTELIEEFNTRGKSNVFIDNRIGKSSTKLSEEDKMRLRYLREQKEQMKNTKVTKKRNKFNLDDMHSDGEGEDNDFMGFTHRGRKLEDFEDDYKDDIPVSSEDEADEGDRNQKGNMTE